MSNVDVDSRLIIFCWLFFAGINLIILQIWKENRLIILICMSDCLLIQSTQPTFTIEKMGNFIYNHCTILFCTLSYFIQSPKNKITLYIFLIFLLNIHIPLLLFYKPNKNCRLTKKSKKIFLSLILNV